MKRVLITCLAMLCVSLAAHAAAYIGGMKLTPGVTYTKNNCKWITRGSVLFEEETNRCTLYLTNVIINTNGQYEKGITVETGIYHNATFNLTGENFVISDLDALSIGANYNEIEGEGGTLDLYSSLKAAVSLEEFGGTYINDLRLWKGVTFRAEGKQAIYTKSPHNSVRVSENCNLWLKSNDGVSSAVEGALYFYIADGMSFLLPEEGTYDQNKRYVVDRKGNKYLGEVQAGVYHYLTIGDEKVSSWNWDHLNLSCVKKGKVYYDHENHVLTFDNATLEWDEEGGDFNVLIYFRYAPKHPKSFTIRLIGDNYLNLNKTQVAIYPSECSLRIEGDGTLNIHSPAEAYRPMVYITPHYPVTLACKEVKIVSESTNYNNIAFMGAVNSSIREDRKLIIDNTRLDITSPEYTFFEVDSIITKKVDIIEPEGAYFDYDAKKIKVGNEKVVPHVVFDVATYPVYVKGDTVTWKNKDDVLGDGTVKYIPEKKQLILNNANISTSENVMCIQSEQEEFNIYLQGKNSLTSENIALASSYTDESGQYDELGLITISGPGSLDVKSSQYGIECSAQNLLLYNCGDVTVRAPYGVCGVISLLAYAFSTTPTKPAECLGILNSNLTVEALGEESYPIVLYGVEFDKNSVEVVEPESWKFEFPFVYDTSTGTDVPAKRFVVKKKLKKGDVNLDGSVDINDVVAIINVMAGTANWPNANVNDDSEGKVDINDVVAVINIMAGN